MKTIIYLLVCLIFIALLVAGIVTELAKPIAYLKYIFS